MSFLLFEVHGNTEFRIVCELSGSKTLWGKDGAVARCAQQKIPNGGRWRITEAELVQELKPEKPRAVGSASAPLGYAIIDDLVPRGPEILMGRILEVAGYLDNPYTADPLDRYNPIMITMEEVLHLKPGQAPAAEDILERERIKHTIQVPSPPGAIIRSVNYLWKSWRPSGFFRGALLWPRHWSFIRGD